MKHFLQLIAVVSLGFILMSGACGGDNKESAEVGEQKLNTTQENTSTSTKEKVETTGNQNSTNQKKGKATLGGATAESNADGKAEIDAKVGASDTKADKTLAANEEQITVLLKDGVSPDELIQKVGDYYGLKQQGRTSRSENRWMFAYDSNKIYSKSVVELIIKTGLVKEAQLVK